MLPGRDWGGAGGDTRPGNAGSNTAADHIAVLDLALEQLDEQALKGEVLVRADGAGATHELTVYAREANMRFSVGFDLGERVREAILAMPGPPGSRRFARTAAYAGTPRYVRSPAASTSPPGRRARG